MEFLNNYYSLVLTLHIISVSATILVVISADLYGLRWILGSRETLDPNVLRKLHYLVWVGLGSTIIFGSLLFIPYKEYLIFLPAFQIKIFLVGMLVANSFVISRHLDIASTTTFKLLSPTEQWFLLGSGVISVTGWAGALVAAQFLGL